MGRGLSQIQKALLIQIYYWITEHENGDDVTSEIAIFGRPVTAKLNIMGETIVGLIWRNRPLIYHVDEFDYDGWLLQERKVTNRSLERLEVRGLVRRTHLENGSRMLNQTHSVFLTPEGRRLAKELYDAEGMLYLSR